MVGEQIAHFVDGRGVAGLREDVRELMIDQCPGAAGGEIEMFAVGFFANLQEAGFAEDAIGVNHVIDGNDGVFAGDEPGEGRLGVWVAWCLGVWVSKWLVGVVEAGGEFADLLVEFGNRRWSLRLSGPNFWAA